jgi:5-methylcytosine-specific restriction endonuclease McrA
MRKESASFYPPDYLGEKNIKKEKDHLDHRFSPEELKEILETHDFSCSACRKKDVNGKANPEKSSLIFRLIIPEEKQGLLTVDNATVLCQNCDDLVEKLIQQPPKPRIRLTKTNKRKLWETKGRTCQNCGLKLVTGGGKLAIHPFKSADWDGTISGLQVLCSQCLGNAASKRDAILSLVEKAREEDDKRNP